MSTFSKLYFVNSMQHSIQSRRGLTLFLVNTERYFLKIWVTVCISVPQSKFWGTCPCPSDIYAHVYVRSH